MSDEVKVAGLIMSGMACTVLAVVGVVYESPILLDMAYSFGGVFGLIIGNPVFKGIGAAVKKLATPSAKTI